MTKTEYISNTVKSLVKKHGTRDPFSLCDELGIKVRYKKLGKLNGFFFYQSRIRNIVLSDTLSNAKARILCAHELGHACLHSYMLTTMRSIEDTSLLQSGSIPEYEANVFAAELLIPDEKILESIKRPCSDIYAIAKELCVPPELIDFKLRVMKNKGYSVESPYLAQSNFLKNI